MRDRVRVAGVVVLVADQERDQFGDAARRRDPRSAAGARGEVRQQLRRDALRVHGGSVRKHRHAGSATPASSIAARQPRFSGARLVERRAVREVRDRTQRVAGVEEQVLFGPVVVHSAADGEIPRREDEGPRERRDDARGDGGGANAIFDASRLSTLCAASVNASRLGPSSSPWPLPSASPSARGTPTPTSASMRRVDAPTTERRGPGPVAIYLEQCQRPEDLRPGLCIVAEAQDGAERPADERSNVESSATSRPSARTRVAGSSAPAPSLDALSSYSSSCSSPSPGGVV